MSRGLLKSTIREIKSSFGRYMAILLIVALGVGFFSGLKASHETMLHTAQDYWNTQKLYDYRLVSTLGFDEDYPEQLADEKDVAACEGGKSQDMLVTIDGSDIEAKILSLPEQINVPELTGGRMPEKENECIGDAKYFDEDAIGTTITLSEDNAKENLQNFSRKEYTIVGIARSPLYALYSRGTTSIGDGTLNCFIYVEKEAFDTDYLTEIYVRFNQTADLYSDAYDTYMDQKEEHWQELCEKGAGQRYDRIYGEAAAKLQDGENELSDRKKEGQEQLDSAKEALEAGKQELASGKQQLDAAGQALAANEKKLEESRQELTAGEAQYQQGMAAFQQGEAAYQKAYSEYRTNVSAYQTALQSYQNALASYRKSTADYQAAVVAYQTEKDSYTEEQQQAEEQRLAQWKAQLDKQAAQLKTTGNTLQTTQTRLQQTAAVLQKQKEALDQTKAQLDAAGQKLANGKKELADGQNRIEQAKAQLAAGRVKLAASDKELENGQAAYEQSKETYDTGIQDAEEQLADGRKELEALKQPDTYVLGRSTNAGYANFKNDADIILGVAKVFPIFFFLVAALVCMTTMTRMIEEQRTQIGVLNALGYSNMAIVGKYITYAGSAAILGGLIGFFIGTWAFSYVIWTAYKMLYNMGAAHYVFDAGLAVLCIVVALICSVGTTVVCCAQELREMAATLMRPKAPKTGKRVLLERVPWVWNRLKFLDKVSVRNLFRYKKRFFMMIIGVSGCTALLVAGMGVRDSIATVADTQFDTISFYDIVAGIKEDNVTAEGIREQLPAMETSADLTAGDKMKNVSLLIPKEDKDFGDYMDLHTKDGIPVAFPKSGEAVISGKLADQLNVKVGDRITLQNGDLKGGTVTVSGIYLNYFNHYVILGKDTYTKLFDAAPEYNALYVRVDDSADIQDVAAGLSGNENVTMVTVSDDVKQQIADMMVSLDYVVLLVIACGAMLAFVVIYNLNNINITERVREIATIKVLGFYQEETRSYVFRENIVLTLLGSIAGIIIGHYLHAFIMDQIQIDAIAFDVHVTAFSYGLSVVLTLAFNQIVNWFMAGKLERINMTESLKSVD